jgi:hypothetical protein
MEKHKDKMTYIPVKSVQDARANVRLVVDASALSFAWIAIRNADIYWGLKTPPKHSVDYTYHSTGQFNIKYIFNGREKYRKIQGRAPLQRIDDVTPLFAGWVSKNPVVLGNLKQPSHKCLCLPSNSENNCQPVIGFEALLIPPNRDDLLATRFNWKSYSVQFVWYICEPDGLVLTGSTQTHTYVFDCFCPWIIIRYYNGLPLGLDKDNMGGQVKGIGMTIPKRSESK